MPAAALYFALHLITLHRIDGRVVYLNPAEITSIIQPRDEHDPGKTIHHDARCVIYLSDGKFFAVLESCDEVKRQVEAR